MANPNISNDVLLVRRRVSRILYNDKLFDYPVKLNISTLRKLGVWTSVKPGIGYLYSLVNKKEEKGLRDVYLNKFGKPLYEIFFKDSTTKLWGVGPDELDASWGSQRIKGVSITEIIKSYILNVLHIRNKNQEASLIEEFYYPK